MSQLATFDFFRYHGVWSPGVRLFRRTRLVGTAAVGLWGGVVALAAGKAGAWVIASGLMLLTTEIALGQTVMRRLP